MGKEYFVKVPTWIARSSFLSPLAKTVYVAIISYDPSFPSHKKLCKDTGIKSRTTISKCLKELVHFDLIKILKGGYNTSNTYIINPRPFNGLFNQNMESPIPNNEPLLDQEMDSNKNNIIISNKRNDDFAGLNPENPPSRPLTTEETSIKISQILKDIH